MWSIYDTLILVTGVVVAAIAVLPVPGIRSQTRVLSGLIGGAVILLAIGLGSLRSFRYPSAVWIAPLVAVLVLLGVVADARKRSRRDQADMQGDEWAVSVDPNLPGRTGGQQPVLPGDASSLAVPQPMPASGAPVEPPVVDAESVRLAAWAELYDPQTPPARLAQIAGAYPEFAAQVAAHNNCYPELAAWTASISNGSAGNS